SLPTSTAQPQPVTTPKAPPTRPAPRPGVPGRQPPTSRPLPTPPPQIPSASVVEGFRDISHGDPGDPIPDARVARNPLTDRLIRPDRYERHPRSSDDED